jgi:hypothetical protein
MSTSYSGGADYGLYVDNSRVVVSDTLISGNGDDSLADYGLYVTDASASAIVTVTNSTIQDNLGTGIRLAGGQAIIRCSAISDNRHHGIHVTDGAISVIFASISNNGGDGFRNDSSTHIDARHNWWGDPSGPGGVGSGIGDEVTGNVLFAPWLTEHECVLRLYMPIVVKGNSIGSANPPVMSTSYQPPRR